MPDESCISVPKFERLKYFYGQMLGVSDLQSEQDYFREKLKLHNRCLHGYGVVCGLRVVPLPPDSDCPANDPAPGNVKAADPNKPASDPTKPQADPTKPPPICVEIEGGFALDCEGNEIIVRRRIHLDLMRALSAADKKTALAQASSLYISICFCEEPADPVRPVIADACGVIRDCTYGKIRDGYKLKVSLDPPAADHRCETCCEPCIDCCILLARIDGFEPGKAIDPAQVHNEVRRLISTYPFTNIVSVNWTHGATYSRAQAADLLGTTDDTKGLVFRFSRPILSETIKDGVLDVWVIEGGRGRAAGFYSVEGTWADFTTPTVTEARFYQTSDETLQLGDRVLITLHSAFLLDECCRPLDGTNVGGLTPDFTAAPGPPDIERCPSPPQRYGPWTSGNGIAPGQSFESWFFVREGGKI